MCPHLCDHKLLDYFLTRRGHSHPPSPPPSRATRRTDPFSSNILDVIEESLQRGKATCVAFNRRGTLLAAGTTDGVVVIWVGLALHSRVVSEIDWLLASCLD
jgi:hypothetical protein